MGRRVIITGGSRGIGAACVKKFAAEGDRVVFFYRQQKEAAQGVARLTGSLAIPVDLTDGAETAQAMEQAITYLGGVDVLVNNAGISHIGLFQEMTDQQWQEMIAVNLTASFVTCRQAAPYMIRQHSGCLLQMGSMWGKRGASCEAAYSAAKAGLRGLTMALCKELGPSGIRVNCVEPGVIQTDMNRFLNEQVIQELADETPMGRLGAPEEVAEAVWFLCSDKASFITGQILGVDGGFAV